MVQGIQTRTWDSLKLSQELKTLALIFSTRTVCVYVGWYHSPGVFTIVQAFEGAGSWAAAPHFLWRAYFPPLTFIQEAKDGAAQNPIALTKPVLANLVKVKISTVRGLGL